MSAIHATAIVEAGAKLADGVKIGPFCTVSAQAELGPGVELVSHVSVLGQTSIGARTKVYPFAVLGAPPQHLGYQGEPVQLVIGEGNIIREHVTMHAGTPKGGAKTQIGDEGFFMVGSHVGHDCHIGNRVILTNDTLLGGHCEIGDYAILGGGTSVHQFVRIGRYAMLGGASGLEFDLIPFGMAIGARAGLAGLNLVGLKRRGFSREVIHALRNAVKILFETTRPMPERIADLRARYPGIAEVEEVAAFIESASHRPLCTPRAGQRRDADV